MTNLPPMDLPSREDCRRILADIGVSGEVMRHIEAVTDLAIEIAECVGADLRLVTTAAMLHDAGRAVTHGIDHAVVGARLLEERGLPPEVVRIVERHIGSGITAAEAAPLGLPARDYLPATLEERVVAHADNLISGERRQTIAEHLRSMRSKGLDEQAERAVALHRELSRLCDRDLDEFCR